MICKNCGETSNEHAAITHYDQVFEGGKWVVKFGTYCSFECLINDPTRQGERHANQDQHSSYEEHQG